jgi:hypothetical protein
MRQAEHLYQIGQRALAAVVLPVGIGDEGDRSVEGQIFGYGGLVLGIERQHRLQPHQAVDDQETADMEQQHRDRIGQPMLLSAFVDAGNPVESALDRPQHRRQEGRFAVEHPRHVPAERLDQRDNNGAVENDLDPADGGHCIKPFEGILSATARQAPRPEEWSAVRPRSGAAQA